MKSFFTIILFCFLSVAFGQKQLLSPTEFLGYELGDRFTRHHRVVEYYKHVAEAVSDKVTVQQYGETYEHRPLIYAVVASAENFQKLDQIREDNLRRSGMMSGAASTKVAIVWLSYNVHGNEANSTEASMKTLYELVNPQNAKTKEFLKNTVVILDPCINPDGRDRYANYYNQWGNTPANSDPQALEHREPWPGGRANHYLFDLNRDWAWETQIESQHRIKLYNQWMPQVHVDFHEQGYNSPYYFAPAAEPYHEVITNWQREFQHTIGKNNAKYFDEQGWLYFTKERFDLYYPSYGDTYPTYSGGIGMTYEQGGIGAGLSITTADGDPLTLKDRLTHHYTNGISTIEISSQNANRLLDEFEKFFKEVPNTPYKSYVIKAENNPDKIKRITEWLKTHNIQFGHPAPAKVLKAFHYHTQQTADASVSENDIVFNIFQPKGKFITTVFEPKTKLTDSLTYDITAWNLFYAFGLKALATSEKINVTASYQPEPFKGNVITGKPYAYIFKYKSLEDAQLLASLLKKGVKVRCASKSFVMNKETFDAGTLIITRKNNEQNSNFDIEVQAAARALNRKIYSTTTGFAETGADFGSSLMNFVKAPKIALLAGSQTSSLAHGQIWHFFEQQIHYPVSVISTDYFTTIDLWKYDVLVVPDGSYRLFDEATLTNISRWIGDGGKLILLERACYNFADKKGFALKEYADDDARKKEEKEDKQEKEKESPAAYGDAERKSLRENIFGAIYKVSLDATHPLSFGLDNAYYSLRTNEVHFPFLDNGWNVGTLKGKQKPLIGFSGNRINRKLENTVVFGVEEKGKGQVVYMTDNPVFRGFWENGKILFANAVFMVGQ
jgi:hypothetical protein